MLFRSFYVVKQILNYNGKTIGFLVSTNKEDNKSVYVPCYPSRMIKNLDITYPDDIQWNNYYDTLTRLNNINSVSNNNIKCKPVIKIVEDDLIIGFLTKFKPIPTIKKFWSNFLTFSCKIPQIFFFSINRSLGFL